MSLEVCKGKQRAVSEDLVDWQVVMCLLDVGNVTGTDSDFGTIVNSVNICKISHVNNSIALPINLGNLCCNCLL